jgi:hypothetical protein
MCCCTKHVSMQNSWVNFEVIVVDTVYEVMAMLVSLSMCQKRNMYGTISIAFRLYDKMPATFYFP